MKFEVLNDFKGGGYQFEEGNSHNSEKLNNIDNNDVERWHRAGFVKGEGMGDAVALNPNHTEIKPNNVVINLQAEDVK